MTVNHVISHEYKLANKFGIGLSNGGYTNNGGGSKNK